MSPGDQLSFQSSLYRFFHRLFSEAPSKELLSKLATLTAECHSADLGAFGTHFTSAWDECARLAEKLSAMSADALDDYLSSAAAVYGVYFSDGLILEETEGEAGIAGEFSMMAQKRKDAEETLENGDDNMFISLIKEQQICYKEHIAARAPFFSYRVAGIEEKKPFYRPFGRLLGLFLQADARFMQDIVDSAKMGHDNLDCTPSFKGQHGGGRPLRFNS